jgi:hypothetical protein
MTGAQRKIGAHVDAAQRADAVPARGECSPRRGTRKLSGWFDLNQIEELVELRLKRTEIGARLNSQGYLAR